MTQEELDALMNGGDDALLSTPDEDTEKSKEEILEEETKDYKVSADGVWPPPPPNAEHKVVHQLDDVTRDSEEKATELMDKLEIFNNIFADTDEALGKVLQSVEANIALFDKLAASFPAAQSFKDAQENNNAIKAEIEKLKDDLLNGQDEVMMAMDGMQYQDIHRQKIERVINVMRALSRYMSSLFEGKIEDEKRVSSAAYIAGDANDDVVDNSEIEALIASLGNK